MSRGLGRVERLIIGRLSPKRKGHVPALAARGLFRDVQGGPWSEPIRASTRASVYQALASLERKGIVTRLPGHIGRWSLAEAQRQEADRQREKASKEAQREKARQRRHGQARHKANGAEPEPGPKQRHPHTRLVLLLGMLGSAHDGEALNAARAVEAERRKLDVTWEALLDPAGDIRDLLRRWR